MKVIINILYFYRYNISFVRYQILFFASIIMLPVITVPAAPIRKQYFFHGVYIVFFCFGRFKNIQCSSQISDIFFHKIRIISPADQFQVCDARFLKAIKCTKTAAAYSGEVARIVFCRNFYGRCFLSRNVIPV